MYEKLFFSMKRSYQIGLLLKQHLLQIVKYVMATSLPHMLILVAWGKQGSALCKRFLLHKSPAIVCKCNEINKNATMLGELNQTQLL